MGSDETYMQSTAAWTWGRERETIDASCLRKEKESMTIEVDGPSVLRSAEF